MDFLIYSIKYSIKYSQILLYSYGIEYHILDP